MTAKNTREPKASAMKPAYSKSLPSFRNHLLIATPALAQGFFAKTVTFLCEHSEEGAMGLVINQPLPVSFADLFASLELPLERQNTQQKVFAGGPVNTEHGFILHNPEGQWESSLAISEDFSLTTSRDVLAAIGAGDGPKKYLIALGYAGWGAGQLEAELTENTWLTVKADPGIVFDTQPTARLDAAGKTLGIDIHLMSDQAGHA